MLWFPNIPCGVLVMKLSPEIASFASNSLACWTW